VDLEITDADTILRGGELEQIDIISKRVGDEVLVVGSLSAPFVNGALKVGLERWIAALYKKPDLADKVMKHSIEQSIEYARAVVEAGAEALYIEECFAGTDVISPGLYDRFGLPYERAQMKKLNELGVPTILSFTGDPMPILDRVVEIGPTAHHFEESKKGFVVDIYTIREKLREKACMFIPFDAINLLPSNDVDAIEREVENIVSRTAVDGGVILSTGCPILKDTDEKSVEVMTKTARRVGRYPIKKN
jgi:uroporphyrinogen-III decarboxylase